MGEVKLKDDEQDVLLEAAEESMLWEVAAALTAHYPTKDIPEAVAPGAPPRRRAEEILRMMIDQGWIELREGRVRNGVPSEEFTRVPPERVRDVLSNPANWLISSTPTKPELTEVFIALTQAGEGMMQRAGEKGALPRIWKRRQ